MSYFSLSSTVNRTSRRMTRQSSVASEAVATDHDHSHSKEAKGEFQVDYGEILGYSKFCLIRIWVLLKYGGMDKVMLRKG